MIGLKMSKCFIDSRWNYKTCKYRYSYYHDGGLYFGCGLEDEVDCYESYKE